MEMPQRLGRRVKAGAAVGAAMAASFLAGSQVLAAPSSDVDVSTIIKPLTIVKTILLAGFAVAGVIVLILGLVDFFTSLGSHDTGGIKNGIFKVITGILMVAIPAILTLMGY